MTVAPDLVVEILSLSETAAGLEEKLQDYRAAGTRLVWIVDTSARTVSIRDGASPDRVVSEGGAIDGGDVLNGFVMAVERVFARLAREV